MEYLHTFSIIEQFDRRLLSKIECNQCHPHYLLLPQVKESSCVHKPLRGLELIQNFLRIVFSTD